jgi:tetratricopeptide (TPR) repeat protein
MYKILFFLFLNACTIIHTQAQRYDECFTKDKSDEIVRMNSLEDRIVAYSNLLKECPNNQKILYWRALMYRKTDKHLLAIADFERVLLLNPKECKIYPVLAYEYGATQQAEKALNVHNRQIELNCDVKPSTYMSRALANSDLGRYNVALSDYDQAEEGYKTDIESLGMLYYNKAGTYFKMGKYAESVDYYLRCEEHTRKHAPQMLENYYHFRAAAYYGNEQTEKALEDVEKSILLNPNYGAPIALRAYINRSLDKQKEAAQDWKRAIEVHQLNPDVDSLDPIYTQYAGNKPINEKTEIGEEAIKKAAKSAKHSKPK